MPCDETCETCNGSTATNCVKCPGGLDATNGSCTAASNCDASCKTCLSKASATPTNDCTACNSGKYLKIVANNAGTCELCHRSCLTCEGADANKCTSCPLSSVFNKANGSTMGTCC